MTTFDVPCKFCGRSSDGEPLRSSVALFCLPCILRRCFPYFTRRHRILLLGFYVVFAVLTFFLMLPGAVSGHGEPLGQAVLASLFAFSGPFTGMVSRGFDSAYGAPRIAIYCCLGLAIVILFQLVPLRVIKAEMERAVRISLWFLGLLGWFAGTLLSVLVANS